MDWQERLAETPIVGRDVPDVRECYGHREPLDFCDQCDGGHRHEWVKALVLEAQDFAWRCRVCGTRRCDVTCNERRHHCGPHIAPNGRLRQVGR